MLKTYKPITPSLRHVCLIDKKVTSTFSPIKYLVGTIKKKAGRNHHGHITVRHQGSGVKNNYKVINFKSLSYNNIPGIVLCLEYDSQRSSFIALIHYKNGVFNYILASTHLTSGSIVSNFSFLPELLNSGSSSLIKNMPAGGLLYCIESFPTYGSKLVRSAGCSAILLKKETTFSLIKLPSGNLKYVSNFVHCFFGTVSNKECKFVNLGKAGRTRWLGIRPHVRGIAMNPVDHPHGGGEGRKSGKICATSPWGKLTKGQKTSRIR